jgi:FG-GAP repeat
MRRAVVVIAVALATLWAAAWPAVGGAGAQPSPTDPDVRVDFNGDGLDDLAVGVPAEGVGGATLAGAVNILYGASGGLTGTNQTLTQGNPEPGDLFGFAVAKGDFNGDGFTDLAVGAPNEDVGVAGSAGAVNVFYGSDAGLPATSEVRLQGDPEIGDRFGFALDAGLFNDDDVMDLAVGAPGETVGGRPGAGAVSVFYGTAAGLSATSQTRLQANPEQGDRFGAALVAGFFNADQGDLAVGAPGEDVGSAGGAGAVSVFSGGPTGLPTTSQVLLQANPEVGDQFGAALAAGFFSGSNFYDLAVGAPTETVGTRADAGAVSVFLGSASQLSGAAAQTLVQGSGVGGVAEGGDQFGAALATGFFDTGPSDLAIGAPFEDLGASIDAGAVNVVYGSNTGLVGRNQTLTQNSPGVVGTAEAGDLFGAALARGIFLNNFNGDDFSDLAIGVPGEDVGAATDAGAVNVQYGSATGLPGPGGQLFTQDSAGVGGTAESGDSFGSALD